MRKHIFFFSKRERVNISDLCLEITIKNSPILTCNCKEPPCKGSFIKTEEFQDKCLWAHKRQKNMLENIKYTIVKPNTAFPLYEEYKKYFDLNEDVVFAYDKKIYTSHDLPDHLIEHEKVHIMQQNGIGADNWVSLYLRDENFRLNQEIEAYKHQLSVVVNKGERKKLKAEIVEALSGRMYGNIATQEQVLNLLSE